MSLGRAELEPQAFFVQTSPRRNVRFDLRESDLSKQESIKENIPLNPECFNRKIRPLSTILNNSRSTTPTSRKMF
ncbi:unnamed protein product [Didymodactylos carnosus]|uniref:Uncharacterized protein n=1 Tax=Didymodactylos carnosus TaxID=1234261 RepID=A0A814UBP9_9BILA|nr:unnamed protein product [Didymodactylos carnosus]CAF1173090.1 unnamed protein product [Didymodactylos carnosus]CAF3743987.1 unnamed protein product [Didymodactylos carnosus]CAF3936978.1 unnamed protein product [Didymodactylos carnosus]